MVPVITVLLLFLVFVPSVKADGFQPLGDMFVPRSGSAVVQFENELQAPGTVLVAGGSTGYRGATRSAEVFIETENSWAEISSLRVARFAPASTLLPDGRVLVSGGSPGAGSIWTPIRSAEIYDPETGSWTLLGDQPLGRRGGQYSLLENGKMLLFGGSGQNGSQPESEIFDPAALTFSPGALPSPLVRGGQSLFREPAMQVGGWTLQGEQSATQIYENGSWVRKGSLQTARSSASGLRLANNAPLLMGGWDGNKYLRSVEIFQNGRWSYRAPLPGARSNASSALLPNGHVLLVGGARNKPLSSSAVYRPNRNRWRKGPEMIRARMRPSVATLWDGRVLVFGGRNQQAPLASTEVYLPNLQGPRAKITLAPARNTKSRSASFRFSSERGRTQCRLDSKPWQKCKSVKRYRNLTPGKHIFRVRGILWKTAGPTSSWGWRIRG